MTSPNKRHGTDHGDRDDLLPALEATRAALEEGIPLGQLSARARTAAAEAERVIASVDALAATAGGRESFVEFALALMYWVQEVEDRLRALAISGGNSPVPDAVGSSESEHRQSSRVGTAPAARTALPRDATTGPPAWRSQMESVLNEWAHDGVRERVLDDDGLWGAAGDDRCSVEEREWLRALANLYHSLPLSDVLRRWEAKSTPQPRDGNDPSRAQPERCRCGCVTEDNNTAPGLVLRACTACGRSWRPRCPCKRDGGCIDCKWTGFVQSRRQ